MNIFYTFIQAIIQGLTEFLPVSSSGHLVLFQQLFHIQQPNLLIDIFLHFGTLLAVLVFFYKDIKQLIIGFFKAPLTLKSYETNFVWKIIIASIPTAILGLLINKYIANVFENRTVVIIDLLITASFLFMSDFLKNRAKSILHISWTDAFIIGTIQGLAVFPGISRSGSTIVIALLLGMQRKEAGVFSFFIAIPALLGALLLGMKNATLVCSPELLLHLLLGVGVSFIFGLWSIKFLFVILKKAKFRFFSFYILLLLLIVFILRILFHL